MLLSLLSTSCYGCLILKWNIIASWSGNTIFHSCPKHGIFEVQNYKATLSHEALFHKIAWAWAVRKPIVSWSEWEIGFGWGLLTPLACSHHFSPNFLQAYKMFLCQPPSAPSLLATSGCLCWQLRPAVGAEGTTPLYSISPGHSPPHQLCALTTTACLTPSSLRLSSHCSTFNSSPSWPSALGWSSHSSQDKGASCSIGIGQKIHLFEKYFMFSTTSTWIISPSPMSLSSTYL